MAVERNMLNQAAWERARDTETFVRINAGERDLDKASVVPDEDDVYATERSMRGSLKHLAEPSGEVLAQGEDALRAVLGDRDDLGFLARTVWQSMVDALLEGPIYVARMQMREDQA